MSVICGVSPHGRVERDTRTNDRLPPLVHALATRDPGRARCTSTVRVSSVKVVTVVGTRPEIIRLSRVIARLDESFEHVLVHTGQNWDHQLNGVFFEELGVRRPDHVLNVDTSSLGAVLGDTLRKIESVLK